ncbi:MAG: stage II sporulation protein D [Oscillospiraceae bacterium]|jgi:stage II sporulation protein D|nr:stage II sporulation protein D [Oscillospiraceae bacterium]
MRRFFALTTALTLALFLLPLLAAGRGAPAETEIVPLVPDPRPAEADVHMDPAGPRPPSSISAPAGEPNDGNDQAAATSLSAAPAVPGGDETHMIRVLVGDTVQEMSLAAYLFGVLAAEMSADFPREALRAQAVAARTNAVAKQRAARGAQGAPAAHKGADICDNFAHCQAYLPRAEALARWGDDAVHAADAVTRAIRDTNAQILVYDTQPIQAVFHAISGGRTERAADVWGTDIPYLQAAESPGEAEAPGYAGRVELPAAALRAAVQELAPEAALDGPPTDWFGTPVRSPSGGVVTIPVGGVTLTGPQVRAAAGLRSANFEVSADGETLIFRTVGYGHGVGMSQYGARTLALQGRTYEEILMQYYRGVQLIVYS